MKASQGIKGVVLNAKQNGDTKQNAKQNGDQSKMGTSKMGTDLFVVVEIRISFSIL